MPEIDLVDLDGRRWNASTFPKGVVLLDFWATWCAPCREIAPELHAFYNQTKARVNMLSISLDERRGPLTNYVKEHPFPNPIAYGGPTLTKQWGITQMPALVLLRNGKVLSKWQGKDAIRDALRSLTRELK